MTKQAKIEITSRSYLANQAQAEQDKRALMEMTRDENEYKEPLAKPDSPDLLFLRNTQEWPTFRDNDTKFCCLRNANQKKHGFVVEGSFVVHNGYIFNGGDGTATTYESPEAIVADGWTVD